MKYSDSLKDPRWQKERLLVLSHAHFRCQLCGDGKSTLHVHHSYYSKGKKPWQYPRGSMIALCETCHSWFHDRMNPTAKNDDPSPVAVEASGYDGAAVWPPVDTTTPWGRILAAVRADRPLTSCWVELAEMLPITEDGTVEFTFPSDEPCACHNLMRPNTKAFMEGVLAKEFGRPVTLKTSLRGAKG